MRKIRRGFRKGIPYGVDPLVLSFYYLCRTQTRAGFPSASLRLSSDWGLTKGRILSSGGGWVSLDWGLVTTSPFSGVR